MDDAQVETSLRPEPGPSLSLSSRRAQRILRDATSLDLWMEQLELQELGNPYSPPGMLQEISLTVKMARQMQPTPPPRPKRNWLLRQLLFDPLIIAHPLVEREVRQWMVGTVGLRPPKVPDWWTRSRSVKQIEEFRDRCRLWRELLAVRLLAPDSSTHQKNLPTPPSHPTSRAISHSGGLLLPFVVGEQSRKTRNT